MKNFFNEFKEFAIKGNVIDMAIGIVVGSAFSAIVKSLVDDIISPIIATLTSNVNFADLSIVLKQAGDTSITLNYGAFIQNIINFVIITLSIFLVVKTMNKVRNDKEKEKDEPAEPVKSPELVELEKIVDILSSKK